VGISVIKTYKDLEVYNRTMEAAKNVLIKLIPQLPATEKYDLADQLRRCCKAIPALIAEGYAKKHQPRAFQKYLDDALGECNEINTHLTFCKEIYKVDHKLCDELIETYDVAGKQLFNLSKKWKPYGKRESHI
jgi:four helix bundle protein